MVADAGGAKSRVPGVPERKRQTPGLGSAPEALRSAIEQTYEATAGSAMQTRDRAREMANELTARGEDARKAVDRQRKEAQKRAEKLIEKGRKDAVRALDEVHGAIDQIQRRLKP
jgi:polyhydroxyalkanoate synthesis regulator phasin